MNAFIAVGLGGALGAVTRHATSLFFARWGGGALPLATLAVNTLGCFLFGLLTTRTTLHETSRLFFMTGFIGSFTTFSTFIADAALLAHYHHLFKALAYTAASLFLGFTAYFCAIALLRNHP